MRPIVILSGGSLWAKTIYDNVRSCLPSSVDVIVGAETGHTYSWYGIDIAPVDIRAKYRYAGLIKQWKMVTDVLKALQPRAIISEGVQGTLAARFTGFDNVIYWRVDGFTDAWQISLDKVAACASTRVINVNARVKDMRRCRGDILPFFYSPLPSVNTERQDSLLYVGGIRRSSCLEDAVNFGKPLTVCGKIMDQALFEFLRDKATVIVEPDDQELLHQLSIHRYGWANFAGGYDNYSNNATSRKVREYLEHGIIPIVAQEHVDYQDIAGCRTATDANMLALARQRTALNAWRPFLCSF